MNEMPSGRSMRPSMPSRKKSGTKATIVMIVAWTTDVRISFDASKTMLSVGSRWSLGRAKFSRSLLNTFSTSMIASSTSDPIAMAMPPRLIVLIVSPIHFNARIDTSSESGSATSEMTVVRKFIRKTSRTITTKTAPSNSDF